MKIGILGGSFNPIHYGHLILAENVRKEANLDKVIIMPAYASPFKLNKKSASAQHRYQMVRLAVEGNEGLEASDFESASGRVSYTIDTMRMLEEKLGSECQLCFITGADSILEIERWKEPAELLRRYTFLVGGRPGYRDAELEEYAEYLRKEYRAEVRVIDIPKADISSTEIRRRSMAGKSIRYLTPDSVAEYIKSNGLYRREAAPAEDS